jgi:hypothetical protein
MGASLIAIAVLLGLPLLLLGLPVRVAFRLERTQAFSARIAVHALFGVVRLRVRIPEGRQAPRPEKPEKTHQGSEPTRPRPPVLGLLWQAAFRQRLYRLVADVARAAHLHRLRLRMRLGLGDPADTGQLWAIVGPLNALAQNLPDADVRIEPEFLDPVCEFRMRGRLLLVPLQFVLLGLGFALSPVTIRAWRNLQRAST